MNRVLTVALTLGLLSSLTAQAAPVYVDNQTLWSIHELYFSAPDEESWGENPLIDNVLDSGTRLKIAGPAPGYRDVRLVNENGASCVLRGIRFKAEQNWRITDDDLLDCQAGR
ncbi:hypothetical protein [Pseudomonas sp. 5P_3.1_Bac2]|uniref:hypothetical protein n=1 Tax=Pseudomonas sp. 5P_3.1_Bac2 TaxID=2971617 RepID=UPI0021C620E1|nr:hypothetical protein [Pseudomonas sp. 5P_3.1_Bac2]MCU1716381.1 hypothetical protein [Pseudomonas sp. 5P_3.1_Bac2]